LVLDDFLHAIVCARRSAKSQPPSFHLQDVERYPGAAPAVEKIVQETVDRHKGQLLVKPCPLLEDLGSKIYGYRIDTDAYSGRSISPTSVKSVLRRAVELGLQTIVQLPSRDSKEYNRKKLLSLASALSKYGADLSRVLCDEELAGRINCIFEGAYANRNRLMQAGEEMQWAGKTLERVAKTKLRRLRRDSPNPQVRFALYTADWIHASTGSRHYALLQALTEAAFYSAGKAAPKWVERLEIEKHSRKNLRKKWAQTLRG
jgi:hypothetical protein